MISFTLLEHSTLNRNDIFNISTDISNFHKIMPNYFKSLDIIDNSEKIVLEKISFFYSTINVKTQHVILPPDIHKVFILSGPLSGTSFIETYEVAKNGTKIKISVNLKLNGFLRLVPFLGKILEKRMRNVMGEFVRCSENYSKSKTLVDY